MVLKATFKGAVSPIFRVTLNRQKSCLYGCKRQNNGSVYFNNNPTSAQKLVSFIVSWGWLGWKWISTRENWPFFSSSSYVSWKMGKKCLFFLLREIVSNLLSDALRAILWSQRGAL